jgi:hypothetical protein
LQLSGRGLEIYLNAESRFCSILIVFNDAANEAILLIDMRAISPWRIDPGRLFPKTYTKAVELTTDSAALKKTKGRCRSSSSNKLQQTTFKCFFNTGQLIMKAQNLL